MKKKYESRINKIMYEETRKFRGHTRDFVFITCLYILNKASKTSVNKAIQSLRNMGERLIDEENKKALKYIIDELSKINSDIHSASDRERIMFHRTLRDQYISELSRMTREETEQNTEYLHLVIRHTLKELRKLSDSSYVYKVLDALANGTKSKEYKEVIRYVYIRLKEVQMRVEKKTENNS